MNRNRVKISMIFIAFLLLASCQVKKEARPYQLSKRDKKILEELKKETAKDDSVQQTRLKDPDYLEYVKKTNAENKPVKN